MAASAPQKCRRPRQERSDAEALSSLARRATGSHWSVNSDAAVELMTQAFDDAVDARHELAVERSLQ